MTTCEAQAQKDRAHEPLLWAKHLAKRYGRRTVVYDVSFEVGANEVVGLLGPNGAGKTTSFNMATGLVKADCGEVNLLGRNVMSLSLAKRVRLGLGYLPQQSTVFRGLSVLENVQVALEENGVNRHQAKLKSQAVLQGYGLGHVATSFAADISGGERRRLELARALVLAPKVVLLDEPFAGVDPIAVSGIKQEIRQICMEGIGVLLTDHNVVETLRLCDRAYLLYEGRILTSGTPQQIVASQAARDVYLGQDFRL